ncbi:MAG: sensor histidine kinase [Rhodospirillales bacterium]
MRDGTPWSWSPLSRWLLLVLSAVLAVLIGGAILFVLEEAESAKSLRYERHLWAAAQGEVEYLRFRGAARDYLIDPSEDRLENARFRLDILYSRLTVYDPATMTGQALRNVQGIAEVIDGLAQAAEEADAWLNGSEQPDPKRGHAVLAALGPLEQPMAQTLSRVNLDDQAERLKRLEKRRTSITWIGGLFAGFMVVALILLVQLLRQLKLQEKLAADLRDASDAAHRASEAKTDFLARMSHELRTPLNAIIGFSDLLENTRNAPLTSDQRTWVREVRQASHHLLALVNDILDVGRARSGEAVFSPHPFDPAPVIEEAVSMTRSIARKKGISLNLAVLEESLPIVMGEERRFKQVLLNLITNALKYNDPDGSVDITVLARGASLWVSVRDNGWGIPDSYKPKVFEPFTREGDRDKDGIGIGLALSRELIRLMGGDITVDSTLGKGSTFTVTLPLVKVRNQAA